MTEQIQTKSTSKFVAEQRGLTGFETPISAAYQIVREILENSLDSCEREKILPNISLRITKIDKLFYQISSVDNGIGVLDEDIPKAFCNPFTSSKYLNRQDRGMFGLGVKSVLLQAQITSNEPFRVSSSKFDHYGKVYPISQYDLKVDTDKDIPIIVSHNIKHNSSRWHGLGTKFKIAEADFESAKGDIKKYLKLTHAICPYAEIKFILDEEETLFPRLTKIMPEPPETTKFHPQNITFMDLESMMKNVKDMSIQRFLTKYFQGVGGSKSGKFFKFADINPNSNIKSLTHPELLQFKNKMNEFEDWINAKTDCLSLIERECFKAGTKELSSVEFFEYSSRKGVFGGAAFAVEICCVVTGKEPKDNKKNGGNITIRRIVNKIPLIEDYKSCLLHRVFDDVSWNYYNLDTSQLELIFYVHLCSSSKKTLFKDLRKGVIANVPEIRKTLELTLKDVLRKLSSYIANREKIEYEKKKSGRFAGYIPLLSRNLAYIADKNVLEVEQLLNRSLIKETG